MADIDINIAQLEKDLAALKQSIVNFEPLTKNFVEETRDTFKGFNSDFIIGIDGVIKHVNTKEAKAILDNVKNICKQTENLKQSFENFDKETSKTMK